MSTLCLCGCGLPAPIARRNIKERKYRKGEPKRFRVGHARPSTLLACAVCAKSFKAVRTWQKYCSSTCRKLAAQYRDDPRAVTDPTSGVRLKVCTKCRQAQPLGEFSRRRLAPAGLSYKCRRCGRDERKRRYETHRTDILERNKAFKRNHPEQVRVIQARASQVRYARKKNARIGVVDLERIYRRDQMRCHICHGKVSRRELEFDHVIPLLAGGEHTEANLAVSHRRCNRRKGAKVLTLF